MSFQKHPMSRRTALRTAALGGISLAAAGLNLSRAGAPRPVDYPPLKGRLKQSVSKWTLNKLSLDELCQAAKQIGFSAIDAAWPKDWPTLKKYGVDCSLGSGASMGLARGFGNTEHHDALVARYLEHIDLVADAGYRNLVCFSGNRNGMAPEEGMANAEVGLKRILGHAEKRGVTIVMELLNSKLDHPDYLCDSTAWGVALCERISSPRFALIYDIYHMQIMEGDVIATIRKHHQHFAHYHTAGVPGRHEIGADQELNYPAICRAILETGFDGYLAHEFHPVGSDHVAALREAVYLCDV